MLSYNDEKLNRGYIKLFRCVDEWEWYTDIPVKVLFFHILIKANHSNKEWRGIKVERGSFITSLENLAISTGLSIQQIRTAIKKLKLTNEITYKSTSQYSIITVKNYNLYQNNNMQINTQSETQETNGQQTTNNQATTTNNELIMNNNEEEVERERKKVFEKIEKDPYTSKNVQYFLEYYKKTVKKPCRLSIDERSSLLSTLNDLIINQNMAIEDISSTVCKNFINMKSRNSFGINWLLKDSNFYSILNGEWQSKEEIQKTERGYYDEFD